MEIYKDLDDYYAVSNKGNVKSKRNNIILKPHIDSKNKGYLQVALSYNGVKKYYSIHRLVAQTFIPNPNNYPCVNHKDENPNNNAVENLEWCTYSYNLSYGTRISREHATKKLIKSKNAPKEVIQLDLNGNIIKEYASANEAAKILHLHNTHIIDCCNNKVKKNSKGYYYNTISTGGFKFKWKVNN